MDNLNKTLLKLYNNNVCYENYTLRDTREYYSIRLLATDSCGNDVKIVLDNEFLDNDHQVELFEVMINDTYRLSKLQSIEDVIKLYFMMNDLELAK